MVAAWRDGGLDLALALASILMKLDASLLHLPPTSMPGHCLKLCAKNIWFRFCYVACVPYNPWIRHMDVAKGYGGTKKHALHMRPRNSASARARVQGPPCSALGGKIPSI